MSCFVPGSGSHLKLPQKLCRRGELSRAGAAVLEAGAKQGFMEDIRIWAELAVTRFFDGVRFVVRRIVGVPTGDASGAPVQSRRRSQSENNVGSSHEDVSPLNLCLNVSTWRDS